MRVVAILFIVVTLVANFYFNNITSLVVAMFAFPVLVGLLLRKRKRHQKPTKVHPEKTSDDFV
jgi:chromate transport protein ChrA